VTSDFVRRHVERLIASVKVIENTRPIGRVENIKSVPMGTIHKLNARSVPSPVSPQTSGSYRLMDSYRVIDMIKSDPLGHFPENERQVTREHQTRQSVPTG
jgi:hypothetical protein